MGRVLRSTVARFTADISDWDRNIRRLTSSISDVNLRFGGLSGRITGLALGFAGLAVAGKLVSNAFSAMGSAMSDAIKTGIEFDSQIEQAAISFEVLSGSAAVAQDIISNLYEYAAKTPFQFPDVVEAGRALEVVGLSAKKNIGWIGDLAAANPQATIQEVARAMARLKSGDFGESFERLRDFGISKTMLTSQGLKFDKSGAFKGSVEQAMTAVENIVKQKYAGMADAQSKSFKGQISTLKDNINSMFGEIMKPIFNELTNNLLPRFMKAIDSIKNSKVFDWFINGIKLTVESIKTGLIPVIESMGRVFNKTIGYVKANWDNMSMTISSIKLALNPAIVAIESMAAGFIGAINAMVMGAGTFVTALGNMANSAISAGSTISYALKFDIEKAVESLGSTLGYQQKFMKSSMDLFPNMLKAYSDGVQSAYSGFNSIKKLTSSFGDSYSKYTKPTYVPDIIGETEKSVTSLGDTYSKTDDKVKSFIDTLKQQTDAFKNFVGIFDKATADQPIGMDRWLNRLKGQVRALTQYQASVKGLEAKANAGIISQGLFSDLRALGPSAAKQLQLLANASNAQLQQANALYGQKGNIAGAMAFDMVKSNQSAEAKVIQINNYFNGGAKDEETMQISDKIAGQVIKKLKAAGVY